MTIENEFMVTAVCTQSEVIEQLGDEIQLMNARIERCIEAAADGRCLYQDEIRAILRGE